MIDYGSVVYGSARGSYLKRLDYVHHQALRLCLGAFRTSPISSLYTEAFEPSLLCRRDKLSLSYCFRILSEHNHPLRGILLNDNNIAFSMATHHASLILDCVCVIYFQTLFMM
ncbi:hypothetical protein AVEN_94939-1 [Araneus ventricosus]|uniref:Uncharacterized protein n=1 Tax=Araneus ventricosus TaxID=182803 RepID=A0A4Y2DI34_ARAVE|nr:hypothetical protein AVEN_94939-1 [Araneus ventricosus]